MNRIAELRKEKGLSQKELGAIIGAAQNTISNWENGNREPDYENLKKLAFYFDCSTDYLLGNAPFGRTFRFQNEDDTRGVQISRSDTLPSTATPYVPSKYVAPILGRIPAGYPVFAASEIEGYAPIDYSDTENYFWLRVSGDSMINADILDGDLVLIRYQSCADDGQIVAARVNGDEATLKRFHQSGETVMLVPENPKYSPIPVPVSAFASGEASIIGVVVELKRKFV